MTQPADSRAPSGDSIEAIWQQQHINFRFRPDSTWYVCQELKRKIERILLAVGARQDTKARVQCSSDLSAPLAVGIFVATPVPATGANINATVEYGTRAELIARLTGRSLPRAEDIERFPAQWRKIALTRASRLSLSTGDCSLLEQLNQQIFPLLSVELQARRISCMPGLTRTMPRIELLALVRS